ncbi:MAG: GAF domain-containing protein [Gemmatimonadaceae bacterium]
MPRTRQLVRERESLETLIETIGGETELRPLLTRILERACQLIGADDGAIGLVSEAGDAVRTEAIYRMPPGKLGAQMPLGAGLAGRVLETQGVVRVRRYRDLPAPAPLAPQENAVVGVPIRWKARIIGVFGLGRAPSLAPGGRTRRRPFTARHVEALETFARHAAIAIENAHRYERERHHTERLALIARVGQLATADLSLDDLLQRTADATHELLGYENVAIPLIHPSEPETLHLRAFGGAYKTVVGGEHRIPVAQGLMGAAARTREVVLVNDVSADPRHLPTPGADATGAELAVPILLGARVLGVLNVESARPFTAADADGLRVVAGQLAVAIENARLYEAAQRAAVLEERQRLAHDLHDSVAQHLFSATLVAQAMGPAYARDPAEGERRATMLLGLTRTALTEMRALLAELRPLRPDPPQGQHHAPEPAVLARDEARAGVASGLGTRDSAVAWRSA